MFFGWFWTYYSTDSNWFYMARAPCILNDVTNNGTCSNEWFRSIADLSLVPPSTKHICAPGFIIESGSFMLDGVIVCIDGEHYPPVVKEAIQTIARSRPVVAAIFLGGMEKIETIDDIKDYYGIPIFFPKNIATIESILPTILTQYPVKNGL